MRTIYTRSFLTLLVCAVALAGCIEVKDFKFYCNAFVATYELGNADDVGSYRVEIVRVADDVRIAVEVVEVTSSGRTVIYYDEVQPEGTEVYARVTDEHNGFFSPNSEICSGIYTDGDSGTSYFEPGDDRINRQAYALASIYCDGSAQQVNIYGIGSTGDSAGEGVLALSVNYADLPPVPTAEQGNQLISQSGSVRFYRLTSGEYQVNAGPDAEGKEYVAVFDGCPHSYLNVYTLQNGVLTPAESLVP